MLNQIPGTEFWLKSKSIALLLLTGVSTPEDLMNSGSKVGSPRRLGGEQGLHSLNLNLDDWVS